ncbi:MAG: hypothetical protein ACKO9F_08885 [Caldilinea sp.]|jgi:hypothetical protein
MQTRSRTWLRWAVCALFLTVTLTVAASAASTAPGYTLTRWSSAPGGEARAGAFSLAGAAGQPAAGLLADDSFQLNSGFWQPFADRAALYLPMVEKP